MWVKFDESSASVGGTVNSLTVSAPKEAGPLVSKLTPTHKLGSAFFGVSPYSGSLPACICRPSTKLQLEFGITS